MSDDSLPESPAPEAPLFYPVPPLKVVLLTAISGGYYLYYWMYRAWHAYGEAEGYSVRSFWQTVEKHTGYKPSPFWRAVLWDYYALALFPAIDRECRARRDKLVASPILMAFVATLAIAATSLGVWGILLTGLALLPIQVAVNRMNSADAAKGWGLRPVEGLLTVVGALLFWGNV